MLKNIAPRIYQQTILASCLQKNCLVVLPTGMGKTLIALLLAIQRLRHYPNSKVLILSPTKPLVEQHRSTFRDYLDFDEKKMALFTGFVEPEKRMNLWKDAQIIFSTPQGLENDIISGRIFLGDVSLVVFDECHKAVGDYAYVFIAKQYHKLAEYPRILALTASPGSDIEKISEVCRNLFIEDVEVRTQDDSDIREYIKEIEIEWVKVELPEELRQVREILGKCSEAKFEEMKKIGLIRSGSLNKSELIMLQGQLHARIAHGEKDFDILKSVSLIAEIIKVQHALELLETQSIAALYKYFVKFEEEASKTKIKAVKNLMNDLNFCTAIIKTKRLFAEGAEHPKLQKLKEFIDAEISNNPSSKIIVFNQFRDSALKITEEINKIKPGLIKAELFVGQSKKSGTGLTQKRQAEIINEFKLGLFNVLVATSVAEEGLDIPKVDIVIFYEPVPSVIRHIQRRGRTGRQERGRVIVLVARQTRDEAYVWSARNKEKRMVWLLRNLKSRLNLLNLQTTPASPSFKTKEVVLVDYREKGSAVMKELIERGVNLRLEKLNAADFVLSGSVGVEFKTVEDFVDSIIDGRLLDQAKLIRENFSKPLIIIEGENDFYFARKIHPNAVNGMLATLLVNFGIPVLRTKNANETASLLHMIAKKEQEKLGVGFDMHGERKPLSMKEQQEFIVSAFPGIGKTLCRPLLKQFGCIKNIINANEEDLKKVDLIGPKKAGDIRKIVESLYKDD